MFGPTAVVLAGDERRRPLALADPVDGGPAVPQARFNESDESVVERWAQDM